MLSKHVKDLFQSGDRSIFLNADPPISKLMQVVGPGKRVSL